MKIKIPKWLEKAYEKGLPDVYTLVCSSNEDRKKGIEFNADEKTITVYNCDCSALTNYEIYAKVKDGEDLEDPELKKAFEKTLCPTKELQEREEKTSLAVELLSLSFNIKNDDKSWV